MSPGVPYMGYTYLNLLDSPELLQILVTLSAVIKLLRQGYLYFKLRKTFSKFYRRHSALVEKYNVILKKSQKGLPLETKNTKSRKSETRFNCVSSYVCEAAYAP